MRALTCALAIALGALAPRANAADEDDLYFIGRVGTRVTHSAELISGASAGFCPMNDVGVGVSFDQVVGLATSAKAKEGSLLTAEGRWFLEPFEVAVGVGAFWGVSRTYFSVVTSGAYLLALTPSLAARADLNVLFRVTQSPAFYSMLGVRVLF